MTRPQPRPTAPSGHPRGGFTLVELLVVFVVLSILVALLLPAINGAVRTAKNTAAQANLKQLDQALAAFKTRYGDYPPSRILLSEDGLFPTTSTVVVPGAAGQTDVTYGQLAQRSLQYLRKFFPKAVFSTSGKVWADKNQWYDFNGNGVFDQTPYVLEGHQCLVFFLGGLPQATDQGFAMTGFAKNPANPFTPAVLPSDATSTTFFSQNREQPLFDFAANRLQAGTNGFPGYMDSLGNPLGGDQINFIAYFSSYGNNAYDPNDVNFAEKDDAGAVVMNGYKVRFPVYDAASKAAAAANSPAPNPYTSTATTAASVTFVNPQTYQLISSGIDGLYGPGGEYKANTAGDALPSASGSLRQRERDNLTNFHGGTLD